MTLANVYDHKTTIRLLLMWFSTCEKTICHGNTIPRWSPDARSPISRFHQSSPSKAGHRVAPEVPRWLWDNKPNSWKNDGKIYFHGFSSFSLPWPCGGISLLTKPYASCHVLLCLVPPPKEKRRGDCWDPILLSRLSTWDPCQCGNPTIKSSTFSKVSKSNVRQIWLTTDSCHH